ncbi:MAG: helix-turn-helix domain-containing protein [Clostridia bacterium]|nr:helix-turn-helix domain-containing protein [Clostridia bacterium]
MNNKLIGDRIKAARLAKGMKQETLGEKLGVSFQAVSSWETGKFIPDSDHLPALSRELDLSIDALLAEENRDWELKPINYDSSHMFTFVKGRAQMLGLEQTLAVLDLLREAHGSQERRSRHGFATTYMVHPLTMACHALAMGIRDDHVLAAALAHDMVEDAGWEPEDLPVSKRVQKAVRLVSKNMYNQMEKNWEDQYYDAIRKDPLACMVKCLDRINNLAGMADAFTREKMIRYAEETDRYYPALLDVIKKIPEWNDAWWLMRYQLLTMLETYKRLL